MSEKSWSWFSVFISGILIFILLHLWTRMNEYDIKATQLVSAQEVDAYLADVWEKRSEKSVGDDFETVKIKTGIFVQSLKFYNSSEVNLTGYLWQYYQNGLHDALKPAPGEVGFIFPEQVNSGFKPKEVYRYARGDGEVIGWYFESTLRQPFQYDGYPFDHKTVWVRMWSNHFEKNVVLVPDFEAYQGTGLDDIFGIEENIVLGTWERANTFFDYHLSSYGTNFGIQSYIGQEGFPELHYNFVIKRKFENAFIVHLLPLFLVSALLFAALLTVSGNKELAARHGFSTSGVIGTSSALFFVVLLAHIQLREQFAGTSVVYMEYFYFLMYAMLLASAVNTFLFSMRAAPWLNIVHYKDNLIPKVLFWPVVLACMVFITFLSL